MNKRIDFEKMLNHLSSRLLTSDTEGQNYMSNLVNFLISGVNQSVDFDIMFSLYDPGVDKVESKTGRTAKVVCYDFLQNDISKSKKLENDLKVVILRICSFRKEKYHGNRNKGTFNKYYFYTHVMLYFFTAGSI